MKCASNPATSSAGVCPRQSSTVSIKAHWFEAGNVLFFTPFDGSLDLCCLGRILGGMSHLQAIQRRLRIVQLCGGALSLALASGQLPLPLRQLRLQRHHLFLCRAVLCTPQEP